MVFDSAVQGVMVSGSEEGQFVVDDGSGIVELSLSNEFQQHEWKSGLTHNPKSSSGRNGIFRLDNCFIVA